MNVLDPLRARTPRAAAAIESRLVLLRKATTFAGIGFVNAAIDFAVFWTAVQAFGLAKIPANMLAWLVAVSASYMMNTFITFAVESGRRLRWRAYGTFVASGVLGMIANTAALVVGEWLLAHIMADTDLRLALAKIGAIGASFVVNFSMSHFVVFRPRADAADESH
jgi:putative flippase GtrA